MTYGFRPENWAAFRHELRARGIDVRDVEKMEIRPRIARGATGVDAGVIDVTLTLRSGRVETWSQHRGETAWSPATARWAHPLGPR